MNDLARSQYHQVGVTIGSSVRCLQTSLQTT